MTWQAGGNNSIAVPVAGTNNDYTIDFGDGTILTHQTGPVSHIYSAPGVYTVTLSGEFSQIRFQNVDSSYAVKLLTVEQWGTTQWTSMQGAFRGCTNLTITASDTPDLSLVTDAGLMFANCSSLNQSLNNWDVSNVQNMEAMFSSASSFNQPLDNWDVSNVINFNGMFSNAASFNQNINNWDVSNATSLAAMFTGASSFNQPLSDWDVSNVVTTAAMFMNAYQFNQPIGNWDVSGVTDMNEMFYYATSFNQPLSDWDFSGITTVPGFLYFIRYSALDTANYEILLQRLLDSGLIGKQLGAYNLQYCPSAARYSLINDKGWTIFGDILNTGCSSSPFITTWTVPASSKFITLPVKGTGNNYTVNFGDGTVLTGQTGQISHSYPSAGTYTVTMSGDFHRLQFELGSVNATKIRTVEQWGSVKWTTMFYAFAGCKNLKIPAVDAPDLSDVTNMNYMFFDCDNMNEDISGWDVSNITTMQGLFASCKIFNKSVENWDVSGVTNMYSMFAGALAFNKPLNGWDVSGVTDMGYMFNGATSFNQSLNNWDVSNVTKMNWMFAEAEVFNKPIGSWDTSSVTDMTSMFDYALMFNQPIGNWDVSNVTRLYRTFAGCSAFNQNINNWNVSNVTTLYGTFLLCTAFNQPLNNWDVSNVTDMYTTFLNASSFNQPLNNWNVSNVTSISSMFSNASSFNQPLDEWNFNPSANYFSFINNSGLNIENYDALLQKFLQLGYQNKNLGAVNLEYCDQAAHDALINSKGWVISGDNVSSDCSPVTPFSALGINESYNMLYMTLYPNPADNQVSLNFREGIIPDSVSVYNMEGRLLLQLDSDFKNINLENFSAGTYIVKTNAGGRVSEQLLVKK
ncbi:BspA family leucine-rich repeat surface protein [Flavobacterium coralii]|uniref:BspA family leucine-rich repeat surface protein n=1 Tax=Flavobacterium coralii TaxID=2838017 RepID=UPI0034DB744A